MEPDWFPEPLTWQSGAVWALGVVAVMLFGWLWADERVALWQFLLALITAAGLSVVATSHRSGAWGWLLVGLLLGLVAFGIYLAWGGEERPLRLALKKELRALEQQLREDPSDPMTWIDLGEVSQRLRRYHQALQYYERAAALEPHNWEYQQKVKQMQHIIEGMATRVRACPACNAPVYGREFACPKCGEVADDYLYIAQRFGRKQYLLVAGTALGALVVVFALGMTVGWRPKWLVGALVASGLAFVAISVLQRSRRASGGG